MTTKIAPTVDMISAVAQVQPSRRFAARRVAEETFFKFFPLALRDHPRSEAIQLAGQAAGAEVIYRFRRVLLR